MRGKKSGKKGQRKWSACKWAEYLFLKQHNHERNIKQNSYW